MLSHNSKHLFRASFFLVIATALFTVGCGMPVEQNEEPSVSTSQAELVSTAIVRSSSSVQKQVMAELTKLQQAGKIKDKANSDWVKQSLELFTIKHTVSNPNGAGTIEVTGQGGYRDKTFSLTLQLNFNNWESDELNLSGDVKMTFQMSASGALLTTTTVQGDLKVQGLLESRPEVEVPLKASIEVQTKNSQITVCGEVANVPVGEGKCSQD